MYKKLCLLLLVGAFAAHAYGLVGDIVGETVGGAVKTGQAATGVATAPVTPALESDEQTFHILPVYNDIEAGVVDEPAAPQGDVDVESEEEEEMDVQRNEGRPSLEDAADDFESSGNEDY